MLKVMLKLNPFWKPITSHSFADDDSAGGGGSGDNDGGGDESKEDESKGDDKDNDGAAKDGGNKDETFTLKVSGQSREVTKEELISLAQKTAGADEKFRSAAEAKKQGEKGLRIMGLFEALNTPGKATKGDIHELAGLLGIDASEVNSVMGSFGEGEAPIKKTTQKKSSAEAKKWMT
ncbi:MAG: hypothetical protein ACYTEO_13445 [Planctomycetota bacterium]|jgi:hypothetical protein